MQTVNKTPAIRFKDFNDAWEQRKFIDLYERSCQKNDLSFGADKIISVANMYFKKPNDQVSEEYLRTYNIMRLGYIAFEGNKSRNFRYGRFVENTIGDGIVSHVFEVLRPKREGDLWFWKYLINNESIMNPLLRRSTKSATMMNNLCVSDFLNEQIFTPLLVEQKRIGSILHSLDYIITLHQRVQFFRSNRKENA